MSSSNKLLITDLEGCATTTTNKIVMKGSVVNDLYLSKKDPYYPLQHEIYLLYHELNVIRFKRLSISDWRFKPRSAIILDRIASLLSGNV